MTEPPNSSSLRLIAITAVGLMVIGLSGLYVGLGRKVDRRLSAAALELTAKPCLTERLGPVQPVTVCPRGQGRASGRGQRVSCPGRHGVKNPTE